MKKYLEDAAKSSVANGSNLHKVFAISRCQHIQCVIAGRQISHTNDNRILNILEILFNYSGITGH